MNPFDNQEHQQKNKLEKTKAYSLTLHCVRIREPTLTFDLLSKRVKYGYICPSLCLSSPHSVSTIWMLLICDATALYISLAGFQVHFHMLPLPCPVFELKCLQFVLLRRLPLTVNAQPSRYSSISSWLLENEIRFGSSPQQTECLYLFAVNENLKPCCSMSPILISLKTGDGQHSTKLSLISWQYLLAMNRL